MKCLENKTPAWCYYGYKTENEKKYGKLYNWFAVNDSRGLAPEGFKIATLSDWSELIDFLGGTSVAGGKLKSSTGWVSDGRAMGLLKVSDSTNESQFTALPSGLVRQDGNFDAEGRREEKPRQGIGYSAIQQTYEWRLSMVVDHTK